MRVDGRRCIAEGALRCAVAGLRSLPWLLLMLSLGLGGCAATQLLICGPDAPVGSDGGEVASLLEYHHQVRAMSRQELEWERMFLAAEPKTPETRMRLAMVLGRSRGGGAIERALVLLEGVHASARPEAAGLQPLAHLLAGHYLDVQAHAAAQERLHQQVRVGQMRAELLQQKLDALANIENSMPMKPSVPERYK